jgi:hypothetical protein
MSSYSQEIHDPITYLNLGNLEGLATSYEKCVTNTKFITIQLGKHNRYIPLTMSID